MIECLQNHTPDVIIVDEIGRSQEAQAARDVGNRGVTVSELGFFFIFQNRLYCRIEVGASTC
jgi:hypothetical protein